MSGAMRPVDRPVAAGAAHSTTVTREVGTPAAWLVSWDGVTGSAGRAFVKRQNADAFVARCCYPDNRTIAPLYERPQSAMDAVAVERVARHMAQAVEFIEAVFPEAKVLDRGPILSNLRRWSRQLHDAMRAEVPSPTPRRRVRLQACGVDSHDTHTDRGA